MNIVRLQAAALARVSQATNRFEAVEVDGQWYLLDYKHLEAAPRGYDDQETARRDEWM